MSSSVAVRQLASDPLWLALCPSWTAALLPRQALAPARPRLPRSLVPRCAQSFQTRPFATTHVSQNQRPHRPVLSNSSNATGKPRSREARSSNTWTSSTLPSADPDVLEAKTLTLYTHLHALAARGNTEKCRDLAEYLIRNRREKPNAAIYNAMILSNVSHQSGAAWRVSEYLEEMRAMGLSPDISTCSAVLKVLSVHPDYLLRMDILQYMKERWFELTPDNSHDIAAGLLREGLYEQALERIDNMQYVEGINVEPWLLDMAVYALCGAGEVKEAHRIMTARHNAGELTASRNVWQTLLDTASDRRYQPATAFVWNNHVQPGYINPSSGICLNALSTAARAGDAELATDVFAHLSKRGTQFTPTHYAELITCFLSLETPDLYRALAVLTIMALEKLPPTSAETRDIYSRLRDNPAAVQEAFAHLRSLHEQGRIIPIAALNLIIESHITQNNLTEAMRVYKMIHTFTPLPGYDAPGGSRKSFADAETFNLLLRGCRQNTPPDAHLAAFLISEMLALRVRPTPLTYDRLILVFVEAGMQALSSPAPATPQEPAQDVEAVDTSTPELTNIAGEGTEANSPSPGASGAEFLDWAVRHFNDMQSLGWMPRFGTIERMAVQLARVGDERCWDVLQAGEDKGELVEGWAAKGQWVRRNVEKAWTEAMKSGARGETVQ